MLDEADRLLDNEFSEQVQEIVTASSHSNCQKALFSATLPANAENIAMGMLEKPIRVVVGLKLRLLSSDLNHTHCDAEIHPSLSFNNH